jgi:hypothetical protein
VKEVVKMVFKSKKKEKESRDIFSDMRKGVKAREEPKAEPSPEPQPEPEPEPEPTPQPEPKKDTIDEALTHAQTTETAKVTHSIFEICDSVGIEPEVVMEEIIKEHGKPTLVKILTERADKLTKELHYIDDILRNLERIEMRFAR